jgi:RimJ/RimL family protein N-acetyltransferase
MLATRSLILRRARADDLDALRAIFTQDRAMRYWSTPAHTTLDQTRAFLAGLIASPTDHCDEFVIEKAGQVIGKAGAWRLPEVGFILHPAHWGQGMAYEAMTALLGHLFDTRALPRLTAEADPRNIASLRVLSRLGFTETHRAEKVFQWGDEWCDSVYFALDRADYPRRDGA